MLGTIRRTCTLDSWPWALALIMLAACSGKISGEAGTGHGVAGSGGSAAPTGADALPPGSVDRDGDGVPDPPGPGTDDDPFRFQCDPDVAVAGTRWRRLTARQYEATLRDALTVVVGDAADADSLVDTLAGELSTLPADIRFRSPEDLHGSYRRLDQDVGQSHVEGWYRIAVRLGATLASPPYLTRVFGDCAADGDAANDATCLDDFVRRAGEPIFRRPLSDAEVAFYAGFYGGPPGEDPAALADVAGGLFNAPQLLYVVEHGDPAADPAAEVVPLSAHELASRLSYHFWDSMPDQELLDAADDGTLLNDDVYQQEVQRLFADPRTRQTVREFYRDWLKLEDLPELDGNNGFPVFAAFAGSNLPGPDLREHMIDEVLDLVDYYTWDDPQGLAAVLESDLAFARDDDLAALYGLPAWDGSSEPPTFDAGARPGLLTRAAFLATGSANTRPIMKGVFIRRNVLCDEIPPPPDNAAANPPDLSDTLSTRQVVEELTQQDGSVCAGCHASIINPLGFATEGFDALGRVRTEQTLFDDTGNVVGSAPIDTSSVPSVVFGDDTPSDGAGDLMGMIADSGKADACLVRHYFRFSFGRFEEVQADGCVLEAMRQALVQGGDLPGMLRSVALSPEFRQRNFATEAAP